MRDFECSKNKVRPKTDRESFDLAEFTLPPSKDRKKTHVSSRKHPLELEERQANLEEAQVVKKRDKNRFREERNGGFRCVDSDCRTWVPLHEMMGTRNRNHCPCCLSSKHVDEKTGDRRSKCGARMEAIALTVKEEGRNRYAHLSGSSYQGELMLVHECSGCGFHRINRVAADDHGHAVFALFQRSLALPLQVKKQLVTKGITVLEATDENFVRNQCGV